MATSTGRLTQHGHPAWATGTLTANFSSSFVMNNLNSAEYETLAIGRGHLPGYSGHIPGGSSAYAQRKPQASLHALNHIQKWGSSCKTVQQDMTLVDLRPEQRAMNKVYMYAENTQSNFLKFKAPKTFDHRV